MPAYIRMQHFLNKENHFLECALVTIETSRKMIKHKIKILCDKTSIDQIHHGYERELIVFDRMTMFPSNGGEIRMIDPGKMQKAAY
ncbi:hypothetical protein TNCT_376121 [Trichonephila clavata]|uniref:Uncharacterized protein n=1 Tax=Trichonephila clavata TaxID=2740835 RepID=A0A8X6H7F8_TRICU|nr:hypothetical protein TNCT_376121 [Trichonephila clavata]